MWRKLLLTCALCLWAITACAKITHHIQVGKVYAVIWAYQSDGMAIREFLVIQKIDKDGWVLATAPGDMQIAWWTNLNQALSIKEAVPMPPQHPPTSVPHPSEPFEVV